MAHTLDALLREPFLLPHNRRADWENFSRLADDRTRIVSSSQMSEVDKELFDDGHTSETACYLINIDRLPPPANGKMGRGIFKLGIWVNGQMFDRVDTTHLLPLLWLTKDMKPGRSQTLSSQTSQKRIEWRDIISTTLQ